MSQTLEYFKEITKYPRPSKKEEKIRKFLIEFFSSKWYEYTVDATGNLIVYVPAKNTTSEETIILQAHMDMVCVKTPESTHDFLRDAIDYYEKDGYLYAKDTTLWADNGIGIALAMSAIDFEKHPKMELVFTIDEEDGMTGVEGLDFSLLSWTKILNLDSEDEDEICISSAGGIGVLGSKKIEYIQGKLSKYTVEISGMKGGHSGVEIDKKRGNAIVSLLQFLSQYNENIELYDIFSGVASNVIPSKVKAVLWMENIKNFESELQNFLQTIKAEFDCPDISYLITQNNEEKLAIKNGVEIFKTLSKIQDGVYSMSEKIPGLVQTSMNLWILKIEEGILKNTYLARSSKNEELKNLFENTKDYLEKNGFEVGFDRGYPGWQDAPDSELLQIAKNEFEKVLGKTPKVTAIHAWLECGALVSGLKKSWVNAISIGPNCDFVHSIKERVEISSVEKLERILKGILEQL